MVKTQGSVIGMYANKISRESVKHEKLLNVMYHFLGQLFTFKENNHLSKLSSTETLNGSPRQRTRKHVAFKKAYMLSTFNFKKAYMLLFIHTNIMCASLPEETLV